VGRVQPIDRLAPVVAIHQVVPVGNDVSQWTAGVAERDAAVHAAGALLLERLDGQYLQKLVVVLQAISHRLFANLLAIVLHESAPITHGPPRPRRPSGSRRLLPEVFLEPACSRPA